MSANIEAGQHLLHFRLLEKTGEGGMGVVWKALDTTLDREVAIKVLPATLAGDADRLARLAREAKMLASLNHPNIATVHGLHEHGETRFLTMEFVDGEDLSVRLARGAIPPDEAIGIARQIARGLEAAHAAGVVHRDLKPANIKRTADGRVKILDFGLARAFEPPPDSGELSPTRSPTLTSGGTLAGAILGTAAYMSPEQARGHPVDSRADVWAFGAVLYEMLGGRPAFQGETVSDTLASVLKLEPDYDALPAGVPVRLRRLIARCLQKDRGKRLHHIADARIILEEALAGVPDEGGAELTVERGRRRRERLLWLAAMIVAAAATAGATWLLRPEAAERPHRKIRLALEPGDPDDPSLSHASISPDGERILYVSSGKVFVRDLDAWEAREIAVAEGADRVFWSHDGRSIGFIRDETLSRVSVEGSGSAVILELGGSVNGAAWGEDGRILLAGEFSDRVGLFEVSERGGELKPLPAEEEQTRDPAADGEEEEEEEEAGHYHHLDLLPGGRGVLVTAHRGGVMAVSVLAEGRLRTLVDVETRTLPRPAYSRSGHVLYTRGGTSEGIWALPFSVDRLEATGEPFFVAAGGGSPSVSDDETLLYRQYDFDPSSRLVWVDREGKTMGTIGQPSDGFDYPSLSPDGRRIVVAVGTSDEADLWIEDIARGTRTRLTFAKGVEWDPVWTPDGKRVIYRKPGGDDPSEILIRNADGSGEPETLVEGGQFSLSPDGAWLVFGRDGEDSGADLWFMEFDAPGREPVQIVATASNERRGRVSPDGKYVAYESDESGRFEVYIKRFPGGEGKWQASVEGGTRPRWSPRGDELFWIHDGDLMAMEVRTGPEPELGQPRRLFSWSPARNLQYGEFDMTPDAQRFVLIASGEEPDSRHRHGISVMLVENWLRR